MKRKTICSFLILVMVLSMVLSTLVGCKGPPALLFPKDNYTVETTTVTTSEGDKTVTYHFWEHITYVANPVDATYQSLNVSVPVEIDGVDIDATNAPIFFNINVGGYMSSIAGAGGMAPPPGEELPPGFTPPPDVSGLALAAGYVVVTPGCRGRDNVWPDGTYYGKAPAAIVDLKCAVRYVRSNDDYMPGNADWIIASGGSAGGALSALLGASGNSDLYDAYFEELGANDADDNIYAAAPFCPITDLEHADMAYEWMFGTTPIPAGVMIPGATTPPSPGLVDQTLSQQLKDAFTDYQASLNLKGKNDFGTITADNYDDYLLQYYLVPSANKYLSDLSAADRESYLADNQWITWANNTASFTFADFVTHVGRLKGLPAFDDFEMTMAEPIEFGNETTDARHFTNFSLRYTSGDSSAEISNDLKTVVNLMNPMYFIGLKNPGCAKYWWIRVGTCDNHASLTVSANLATSLENLNKNVNYWMYWDAGHGANEDPEDFIAWVGSITGYTK